MPERHSHQTAASTSKRHAVLRSGQDSRPLWVGDDEDWQQMLANSDRLKCPEPGCPVVLFPRPKEPGRYRRHLWTGPKGRNCTHWPGTDDHGGGGRMTPRHLWVQRRILEICQTLGYEARPEDQHTYADVYVSKPSYALEVQLRPTNFQDRTKSRRSKGAATAWLIAHDAPATKSVKNAYWSVPAVEFKVYDTRLRTKGGQAEFCPWEDPHGALDEYAEIRVYHTTFKLDDAAGQLVHASVPVQQFLREVLRGERSWYPAGEPGMPCSAKGESSAGLGPWSGSEVCA